ncbi:hypothetical protein [uncultured Sphingobacterium sp.]|uniref:phosphorylase family protein n=1 Tax=uncultured Sphingobacterium sp. TaxID=182688 RepID=UPI0025FB3288|nr:hypothetical protein [uncultured Sphingobacterium sp.]
MIIEYEEISFGEALKQLDNNFLTVVTATPLETNNLHNSLSPISNNEKIIRFYRGNGTYYIGKIGEYLILHTQCSTMGAITRSGSIITIKDIISSFSPKAIIMIGIGFGIDERSQNIGDILISESVVSYDHKKVDFDSKVTYRAPELTANKTLLNRLQSLENQCRDKELNLIFTTLLSGETLINCQSQRDLILADFQKSKGGDMEAYGLASACDPDLPWVIIKGISDFADGKKDYDKTERQTTAVNAAIKVLLELLSSEYALRDLHITPILRPIPNNNIFNTKSIDPKLLNKILFELYKIENDKFYITRNIDEEFYRIFQFFGIWIYGSSGVGKTNLIVRHLLLNKHKTIFINLATCPAENIDNFFWEIYSQVCLYYELIPDIGSSSFNEICRKLIEIIKHKNEKELVILIEEIPINGRNELDNFFKRLSSFIILKNFNGLENVKLLLSSIEKPVLDDNNLQRKICGQVHFIKLENWSEKECENLINMITNTVGFQLQDDMITKIRTATYQNPRIIKHFFKRWFSNILLNEANLVSTIDELQIAYNLSE